MVCGISTYLRKKAYTGNNRKNMQPKIAIKIEGKRHNNQ